MKSLLITVVVLVALIACLGFWRGWFEAGSNKGEGKVTANLNVNVTKFKEDKEHFKKLLGEKSKGMKEKLASLKDQTKNLAGEAKAKAEKEIDALTKKHETLEGKMKEVDSATEEKWEEVKKKLADEDEK